MITLVLTNGVTVSHFLFYFNFCATLERAQSAAVITSGFLIPNKSHRNEEVFKTEDHTSNQLNLLMLHLLCYFIMSETRSVGIVIIPKGVFQYVYKDSKRKIKLYVRLDFFCCVVCSF